MNRTFSLPFTLLALVVAFFLYAFIQNYFPLVQSSRANTLTQISFWAVNFLGGISIFILLFFKSWIYKKRKKLLLSLSIFILGFVAIELFLHITYNRPLRFSPHPYLNHIGTPNYKSADGLNMHNSLGMRGTEIEIPKPHGRIRVAILGGSTAYEETVRDWKKDFARQLEGELHQRLPSKDIEVINAALPGWDSWEDLINLEFRLLDFDLDLIIPYEGINDVHARFVTPSAYRADNTGNKGQWERTPCLILLCLKTIQLLTGFEPYNFYIGAPTYTHPETNDFNKILGMTPMEALAKNPPIYYERNLRNIIAVAREYDIHILLATWAWSNQFNDLGSISHYQQGFKEHNEVVKKVALEKNVPLYNFASEMPMDKMYWTEGIHNNEKGVALKAKLFATFLVNSKILENRQRN